ncbi:hypothetical protein [Massilia rhizosphaerae]|uniref:hypothetical protein n=1 Tax=Massilia rhizosphaerae TaxID=2784389 RepID=UPI0018DCC6D2|nr:hypothetical protein [Massilia rhizosphaerae]
MRTLVLTACLAMSLWSTQSRAAASASYKVRDSKPMKDASIQIVSFEAVAGLDESAIKKINSTLIAASASFGKEAKKCSAYAEGHPWGYKLTLEKVLLSEKYLSVVFAKSTVCAGSPDIEKEARVFSIPSGNVVPSRILFHQIFPSAKLATGVSTNKELIDLDEEMVESMIGDSKELLRNYDNRCDFYLKNSSYRVWMDGKNLVLFPEFVQPESFCQKEYVIQPDD